jgi:hypothetical protein
MGILDTRYAVTPDGVYIAYQIMGDGQIDLVWVERRRPPTTPAAG